MKFKGPTVASQRGAGGVSSPGNDRLPSSRMSVGEIAARLQIGRIAVYSMLEQRIIPGVRVGRRWIITRHAYKQWERTCGVRSSAGLVAQPEVTVLN
jgi:excisionase family DNA binding protein